MKNVVILTMSTLPLRPKDNGTKDKPLELHANYFSYPDCPDQNGIPYFSQLEPISTMVKRKFGTLDYVIILATKEAMAPKTFDWYQTEESPESITISAVDFYQKRLDLPDENVRVIPIDENDIVPAIHDTVLVIRDYWHNTVSEKKHLWVDTQGGFRDVNLVMNAILSLLRNDPDLRVVPEGRYSVQFNSNRVKAIRNQTAAYRVFDFVSGINELTAYGKADQLTEYYNAAAGGNDFTLGLVKDMKGIADAIQLCDIGQFEEQLEQLQDDWKGLKAPDSDPLFDIFKDAIERDYAGILNSDWNELDVIEWMLKKKFYQQVLTYIESRIPRYWEKTHMLYFTDFKGDSVNKMKEKFQDPSGYLVVKLLNDIFWPSIRSGKDTEEIALTTLFGKYNENLQKMLNDSMKKNHHLFGSHDVIEKKKKNGDLECSFMVQTNLKNPGSFMKMFFLYKLLKVERNKLNHMGDAQRACEKQLCEIIRMFVHFGRMLEKELSESVKTA